MQIFWILTLMLFASCGNTNSERSSAENRSTHPQETRRPEPNRRLPSCASYCQNWKVNNDHNFNNLSFTNFGYRGIGRCRGHAIVTQKLSQLLHFRPDKTCKNSQQKCMEDLVSKLRRAINHFEVVEIPKYSNLIQLSSDPRVKPYLKGIVAGTSNWFSSRRSRIQVNEFDEVDKNIFYDIIGRIHQERMPYLGVVGTQKISSHALLAYDFKITPRADVICIIDPNVFPNSVKGHDCENYLFYDDQRQAIFYHKGDWNERLNTVVIYDEDDERHKRYRQSWRKYCHQKLKGINCQ